MPQLLQTSAPGVRLLQAAQRTQRNSYALRASLFCGRISCCWLGGRELLTATTTCCGVAAAIAGLLIDARSKSETLCAQPLATRRRF
jgi:hypothetical protein